MLISNCIQPLISVIVPVYKVEEVLARCLDSLSRQSMHQIEILLIDDASPDRCGEICEEYAAKDSRFRVFHNKTNRGLSVARNLGIKHAICDYLMFVDSDDWVHVDFCKDSYECALRYHADLVMFRRKFIGRPDVSYEVLKNRKCIIKRGYKTQSEAMGLVLNGIVGNAAWNKLYRKELFNGISYPEGNLYEDIGTTYKTIWRASSIYYLDKVLYYYCYRKGSISTQKSEKHLQNYCSMSIQQYQDLKEWGYSSDKLDALMYNIALSYCIGKKADDSDENYLFCAKMLHNGKGVPAYFTWKRKVLLALYKYCNPLFELVCVIFSKKIVKST